VQRKICFPWSYSKNSIILQVAFLSYVFYSVVLIRVCVCVCVQVLCERTADRVLKKPGVISLVSNPEAGGAPHFEVGYIG